MVSQLQCGRNLMSRKTESTDLLYGIRLTTRTLVLESPCVLLTYNWGIPKGGGLMSDQTIIAIFRHMVQTHGCSADDILETPELRVEFLAGTRRLLGNLPERALLHRLVYLRKRSKLPRSRSTTSV